MGNAIMLKSGGGMDYPIISAPSAYNNGSMTISFQDVTLPAKFEIGLPYITSFSNCFGNIGNYTCFSRGVVDLIIHGPQIPYVNNMSIMFARCQETTGYWGEGSKLTTITLDFDMSAVTTYNQMFYLDPRSLITAIYGTFDFRSCSSENACNAFDAPLPNLVYLRYAPNTLSYSQKFGHYAGGTSSLDDESLISMINGLNESATGNTFSLCDNSVTRCGEIVGRSELSQSGDYHNFIADAGGTLSLADFCTDIKGWTLAVF